MKKLFKESIFNVLGKDIMIHIVLPLMMVVLAILGYKSGIHTDPWAIGMFVTLKVALMAINYFNYTSYPKSKRMKFHFEWMPVIGGPAIVFDKYFGIVLPFCMIGFDFVNLYNYKSKLL
jgi:hypothetical protein